MGGAEDSVRVREFIAPYPSREAMTEFHHGAEPLRRVALLRALQLGDLLCAVPALRSLRAGLPGAEIALIGLLWARAFMRRFRRYLDDFIEFPGDPGLPEREPDLAAWPALEETVLQRRFDAAIQLHGSGTISNPLVAQFGASVTAGFFEPGLFCPDPRRYLAYPDRGLEVDRLLGLCELLGMPSRGTDLEFPLTRPTSPGSGKSPLPAGSRRAVTPASTSARARPRGAGRSTDSPRSHATSRIAGSRSSSWRCSPSRWAPGRP